MKLPRVQIRMGDLELRTCDKHLIKSEPAEAVEICRYTLEGRTYTVAFWKRPDEVIVLDRISGVNKKVFFKLLQLGFDIWKWMEEEE